MTWCSTTVGSTTLSWPGKRQRHCSEPVRLGFGSLVPSRSGRCCFRSPSDEHRLRRPARPTCRRCWITRPQITSKSVHHAPSASSAAGADRPGGRGAPPHRHGTPRARTPAIGEGCWRSVRMASCVIAGIYDAYLLARRGGSTQQHQQQRSSRRWDCLVRPPRGCR